MPKKTNTRTAVLARLTDDAVTALAALQQHYAAAGGKYSQSDVIERVLKETAKRERVKP